jgi:molybdate transport system regulatory protein
MWVAATQARLRGMSAPGTAHVRVRIDFDSGSSLGPGKVALLERIGVCGSLSQAARELGLSYKRAWNLLDDLNHAFAEPVVATATGGARGGGALVTAFGRQLIARYRKVEAAAEGAAKRQFRTLLVPKRAGAAPAAGSLRRPLARALKKA